VFSLGTRGVASIGRRCSSHRAVRRRLSSTLGIHSTLESTNHRHWASGST